MDADPSPSLPVPRLELRYEEMDGDREGYGVYIRYDLIRRHLLGHLERIPIGGTKTNGPLDRRLRDGRIDLPFRDGCHIRHDAEHLNLPAFAVLGEHVEKIAAEKGADRG